MRLTDKEIIEALRHFKMIARPINKEDICTINLSAQGSLMATFPNTMGDFDVYIEDLEADDWYIVEEK